MLILGEILHLKQKANFATKRCFTIEEVAESQNKDMIVVPWEALTKLSYKTKLEGGLQQLLKKHNKEKLLDDVCQAIDWLGINVRRDKDIFPEYRVKSASSAKLKYEKYVQKDWSPRTEQVFNDLLGLKIIVPSYEVEKCLIIPPELKNKIKIINLTGGKRDDDGYRAIHLYYQKNHYHYPIEIQLVTEQDQIFNGWHHIHFYKKGYPSEIGLQLRHEYEQGLIVSEEDYINRLKTLLGEQNDNSQEQK